MYQKYIRGKKIWLLRVWTVPLAFRFTYCWTLHLPTLNCSDSSAKSLALLTAHHGQPLNTNISVEIDLSSISSIPHISGLWKNHSGDCKPSLVGIVKNVNEAWSLVPIRRTQEANKECPFLPCVKARGVLQKSLARLSLSTPVLSVLGTSVRVRTQWWGLRRCSLYQQKCTFASLMYCSRLPYSPCGTKGICLVKAEFCQYNCICTKSSCHHSCVG